MTKKNFFTIPPKLFIWAALLIADRAAKLCAEYYLSETPLPEAAEGAGAFSGFFSNFFSNFFSLALHYNRGISFSLLKNFPLTSLAASFLGVAMLGFLCLKSVYLRSMCGTIFLWAGAAGNLADRLLYGYVIDWLYVGVYINLADIWLCVGCLMIFFRCYYLFKRQNLFKRQDLFKRHDLFRRRL